MTLAEPTRLDRKTCLVTGGTGGIGLVTARELARLGARVIVVGRNRERGAAAVAAIADATHRAVEFIPADLSAQAEIRRLAEEVRARLPRLDVLINNAGVMFSRRRVSSDGFETTFAVNHLAYFLVTHELLPLLRAAPPARIVIVASEAHHGVALNFDDLQSERRYNGWLAYKRSKLANLLFAYELARRLEGSGVTVNALHPGFVATDIGARDGPLARLVWRGLTRFAAIGPEEGAKTSVHLASSPEVAAVNGQYFIQSRPARSSDASYDEAAAKRLWEVSSRLTRLPPTWP